MSGKRALIVDDSRSARVILSRMLETYGMQVDTAESAEHALEYLRHSRPDVIFMDHLMPGMDGFQAVRAIKANPETAMIPVMMYTSQEGELYVGQARALGAMGVLPKTVKQVDVSRVLYELHLLPDRRETRQAAITDSVVVEDRPLPPPSSQASPTIRPASGVDPAWRQAMIGLLDDHQTELRRFLAANLESTARRIAHDLKAPSQATGGESSPPAHVPERLEPVGLRWPWLAAVVVVALVPTCLMAYLNQQSADTQRRLVAANGRLTTALTEQQQQILSIRDRLQSLAESRVEHETEAVPVPAPRIDAEPVPYGEIPLAGSRLEKIRGMVEKLRTSGFKGKLRVESFVGDFCLAGNGADGFQLAADELSSKRCDMIGNPFEDGLNPAQRQSVDFANFVATLRRSAGSNVQIEVVFVGRKPVVPYPQLSDKLSAGEWNRIGARNNRVEFTVAPLG